MIEPGPGDGSAAALPDADEALLDQALLQILDGAPEAHADVFAERSETLVLGLRASRDGLESHPPRWRRDEGVSARLLRTGSIVARHLSGPCDERVLGLARAVASGSAPPGGSAEPELPLEVADVAGHAPALRALLDDLGARARAILAGDPRLRFIDVAVTSLSRGVHVASSEWGHARQANRWLVAWLVAEAESPDGRRRRATRGCGGPGSGLDAAGLVAEVAEAARRRLEARAIPQGRPTVVVAPGAGGVLVHEAVGHSLEGDVVARGSSFLSGRVGERVAIESLTVLDDPLLPRLAGSMAHDDEGAPGTRAVLIERGVLRGILTDGVRAGFRKDLSTGHGRRQGFRDQPLPRMTNTLVEPGPFDPQELLASTSDGILVTRLERASADPVRGRFQVRVTEGWRIEDGQLTHPLDEGLLVGASERFLHGIEIGSDLAWDDGCGTCGREGQWVPVAVGQPTLRCASGIFDVP